MRRILWKNSYLSLLAVAACAAAASGAIYQWSGAAIGNSDFTDPDNWCNSFPCGTTYPDGTDDDALFPVFSDGVGNVWGVVDLDFNNALTIDDMTIKDGIEFNGHATNSPALTVATLTIDATNAAITVTFKKDMDLTAN